ncbi:NAD(P)H-binding protein [Amycolatopsis sp. NPDC051903]|uniref:NAD(P)H-binding protein n=1 Tax=Amycolatopsis sp. NPDC051903 TaxID=3363936 RepID=UPI0037A7DB99
MLLITGATGNIGRALVSELSTRGAKVRALSRDAARVAALPGQVERAVGDLAEPSTLPPVFDGVERVFLLTPGLGTDNVANAVAAARAAGVRQVVLLSSNNVLGDPMPLMGRWHHEREELVRASGVPWTILRPGGFMSNALEWRESVRAGVVLDPVGPGRFAPIDTADIAAVAAVILTSGGHEGAAYELTGAELMTVADQVGILAAALGRELVVRAAQSPEEVVRSRFAHGAPPVLAAALVEGFERMRADVVGRRTETVERLLGRAPRTFADWCARHAGAF